MKKRIAAILAILMLAGTMSACTKSEAVTPKPTTQTTAPTTAEPTTERETKSVTQTTKKPKPAKPKSKSSSVTKTSVEPKETAPTVKVKQKAVTKSRAVKVTQPATEKPTQKATQKPKAKSTPKPKTIHKPKVAPKSEPKPTNPKAQPKPKPTKPAPRKKTVDISRAVSAGIGYGKGRGMKYDSSLTTGNSSYFPPTDGSIYDSTNELISAVKGDISYLIDSFSGDCKPGDICFNVIAKGKAVYIVYC